MEDFKTNPLFPRYKVYSDGTIYDTEMDDNVNIRVANSIQLVNNKNEKTPYNSNA